jgi:hypothetical protein
VAFRAVVFFGVVAFLAAGFLRAGAFFRTAAFLAAVFRPAGLRTATVFFRAAVFLRVALLVRAAALLLLAGIAITFPIVGRQPHSYHRGAARDRSGRRRVRLSTGSRVEVDRQPRAGQTAVGFQLPTSGA